MSTNRSGTKHSLPKLGIPTQHVRSVSRVRARFIDSDHSFNDDSFVHRSVDKNPSESMRIVTGVLQQNRTNKSALEASVESFGRKVLTTYQESLNAQLKQDRMFESKVRQAPGLFVAIKKKSEQDSKAEQQGPKVTFKLAPQKKTRDVETYANPNDYRSPENQHLLKTIFQSPDNLFKKLQKMKVGLGAGKDGRDRPMEKHESNQRIMTRIFTSEAFHSVDIWRPQTRERATFTRVGKNLALFGGLSNFVDPYIHFFDLRRRTWIEEDKFGEEKWGADQKCYKVDHSACFFSPYLVYFGGEVHDQHGDATSISNEIVWYSIEKDQWDQAIRTKISARELPERKNHLAFLHQSDMYVLGGHAGIYTQHLMDCYKLNLKTLVWSQAVSITGVQKLTKSGSILSTTAMNAKLQPAKSTIAIPGVYVFGGMTNKGPTNSLSVLSISYIGNEPMLNITVPKVAGSPPSPRFGHSTHFLEAKSLLVVVGGQKHKGDTMEREVDVHVLELIDLRWIRVSIKNTSVLNNMAWHAATEDEDRVYIFGGVDRNNYRGADIVSLEFESGPPLARTRFN